MVLYIVVKSSNCVDFISVSNDLDVIAWVFDGVDVGVMRSTPVSKSTLAPSLSTTLLRSPLLSSLLSSLISTLGLNSTCNFVGLTDLLGSSSVVVGHVNSFTSDVIVSSDNVHHVLGEVVVEYKVHG